jgi:hypothetical protein
MHTGNQRVLTSEFAKRNGNLHSCLCTVGIRLEAKPGHQSKSIANIILETKRADDS